MVFYYTGMAGLAVTYGLNLNARLSRWILSFCKLENKIISIERIHQYCQLTSEAPPIIENCRPPPSWPENGTIELIDLKVFFSSSYVDAVYIYVGSFFFFLFLLILSLSYFAVPIVKVFNFLTANIMTYDTQKL